MKKNSFSNIYIQPNEIKWKFSKAKGPGGQKVNKTDSKVQLKFNLKNSNILSESQKLKIKNNYKGRLINDCICLSVQNQRDQYKNRQIAIAKINFIVNECLNENNKKRKLTKPTFSSIIKRLTNKKLRGEIKKNRRSLTKY